MGVQSLYCEKKGQDYSDVTMQDDQEICAGVRKVPKDYIFRFSDFRFCKILYTVAGHACISDNAQEYTAGPDSVCFFHPNEDVFIENQSEDVWEHIYVYFRSVEIPTLLGEMRGANNRILQLSDSSEIRQLFENIIYYSEKNNENSHAICDYYLRILFHKITPQVAGSHESLNSASYISYTNCRKFIDQNFDTIASLEEIANKCHINKIYLCRIFRRYAKTTPMAYVTTLKISKATMLLKHTDYSIKQISLMLHFDDPSHFSRRFKNEVGISPKYYRYKWQDKGGMGCQN